MKQVRFIYEENGHGGGICEGQENESWPSYNDEYLEIIPLFLLRGTEPLKNWYAGNDVVEFEGDINISNGWIVYVTYSNGGTFQITHGYTKAIKAYEKREDAEKMVASIRNGGNGGVGYKPWDKPWEGHFSKLENVQMNLLAITD